MKPDWEIYRDTGILGAYAKENAVLRKSESGGTETIFRDTEHWTRPEGFTQERMMLIRGKQFHVTSVFPGDKTPTDRLLAYIDGDLKKGAHTV